MPRPKKSASPFRYFNSSSEVIRLVVMMYVRFPLSLRNVEDLLAERGISGNAGTAVGSSTLVTAQFGTAVGREANVTHGNSTAVGYQATTTATNQVALGGAGSSVQISDIDASTAAQQGPVDVVTVDAIGTLGRQQAATAQSVQNVQVAIDSIAQVSDAQFTALSSSVSQLSGRVDSLFDLSTTINRDAQRGIASIAAQANPHFPSAAG
ncbi:MAG: hypothetical protein ABJP82_07120, partial [Hyphomicrobiales bacterium]